MSASSFPSSHCADRSRRCSTRRQGSTEAMVLSPFDVGKDPDRFDLLLVDEAHRLTQRASQGSGPRNKEYAEITIALFGIRRPDQDPAGLDPRQEHQPGVPPGPRPERPAGRHPNPGRRRAGRRVRYRAKRRYRLTAQHRVRAGTDYVGFVRGVLAGVPMQPRDFGEYDLRFYDDFAAMRRDILQRDDEVGLARLVAGYAWDWVSKKDRSAYDIAIDGEQVRWNTRPRRLGQLVDLPRRDGLDPHDPGLRPELRGRRHRPRPALRRRRGADPLRPLPVPRPQR